LQAITTPSIEVNRSEEHLYEFWANAISDLFMIVYEQTVLSRDAIKRSFIINGKLPVCIENIINEMIKRNELIPIEALTAKPKKSGVIKGVAVFFWSSIFSKKEDKEYSKVVCTRGLKEISMKLENYMQSLTNKCIEKSTLISYFTCQGYSEEQIAIFFNYCTDAKLLAECTIKLGSKEIKVGQ
jgi:hypothetical protein